MILVGRLLQGSKRPTYSGVTDAGWSSSVARRAHNPEVAGSNPAPATNESKDPDLGPHILWGPRSFLATWSVVGLERPSINAGLVGGPHPMSQVAPDAHQVGSSL